MATNIRRFVHRLEQLPSAQAIDPRLIMHDELIDDELGGYDEYQEEDFGFTNALFNPACELAGIDHRVLETYV